LAQARLGRARLAESPGVPISIFRMKIAGQAAVQAAWRATAFAAPARDEAAAGLFESGLHAKIAKFAKIGFFARAARRRAEAAPSPFFRRAIVNGRSWRRSSFVTSSS
jgi:hypothetical protein